MGTSMYRGGRGESRGSVQRVQGGAKGPVSPTLFRPAPKRLHKCSSILHCATGSGLSGIHARCGMHSQLKASSVKIVGIDADYMGLRRCAEGKVAQEHGVLLFFALDVAP